MIDFLLPSLGADMDRAKLNSWLVEPGDTVHKGQIIAEVETEKAVLEVECWYEGVIEELLIEPGPEWLPVGTVLAHIRPTEEVAETEPATPRVPEPPEPPPPARPEPTPPAVSGQRVKASPRARALATQLGVDLETVTGTGVDGIITAEDIESATGEKEEPEDKASEMRRAIARSMARAKREIPHYYLATHIDLQRPLHWLDEHNRERSISDRILPAAMLLKATALALRQNPELNGHWVDDRFSPGRSIHLGVAVSLREGGLVAPAIHDADQLDLDTMMERLRDLVTRARSWRLRSSEMSEPTVTVTNLGDRGVETAFPIIIPPQVAIVGFGKIMDRPVAIDGAVAVHPTVHASLAADHRVTDGHRGGLLLSALDRLLREPESL